MKKIKPLLIVGQVLTKEDAVKLEFITKNFVVGNRARFLGKRSRK